MAILGTLLKKGIRIREMLEEEYTSPFDLQKADELFITNVIKGIQPITKYRKKEYVSVLAADLVKRLNAKVRFS